MAAWTHGSEFGPNGRRSISHSAGSEWTTAVTHLVIESNKRVDVQAQMRYLLREWNLEVNS